MKTQTAMEPEARHEEVGGFLERAHRTFDAIARRAHELFEHRGGQHGNDMDDWLAAESELLVPVSVNTSEDKDQITVQADTAGFAKPDIKVVLDGNRLIISGSRHKTEENKTAEVHYTSSSSEEFLRVLDLPAAVDANQAEARLDNGALKITLPKAEAHNASQTEIKIS